MLRCKRAASLFFLGGVVGGNVEVAQKWEGGLAQTPRNCRGEVGVPSVKIVDASSYLLVYGAAC